MFTWLARPGSKLFRQRKAATAVEFALIGSYTILFSMGFMMMGICQFWQMTLNDAVRNATRQLLLGNITSESQFITSVCSEFGHVAPCGSNSLQVEIQANTTGLTFAGITAASVNSSGQLSPNGGFPAMPFSTGPVPVLVQVAYHLPPWLDFLPYLPFSGKTIPALTVLLTGNPTSALISAEAVLVPSS
ncbi:TadE/TadG family type IV pilus assembly protein [Acidocella sp.]|uniref:TadE/TadG family type IV pilus assembly protein n=1 Tax=Acidocella sp. TaxID=50710 RepID=UPI003D04126E